MISTSRLKKYIDRAVKREIRRMIDGPEEKLLRNIDGLCNTISSTIYHLYSPSGYSVTSWDNSTALKQAERAIDHVPDAVRNGRYDRALQIIEGVKRAIISEDAADAKMPGGGGLMQGLKTLRNYISTLSSMR